MSHWKICGISWDSSFLKLYDLLCRSPQNNAQKKKSLNCQFDMD